MEKVLFGDPFYGVIINYLSIKDLLTLRQTCKHYQNLGEIIYERILQEAHRRLKKLFGSKLNQFFSVMEQCKAVIAGSFLIQCVLDEDYASDIDIFIPHQVNLREKYQFYYITNKQRYPTRVRFSLLESFLNQHFLWYLSNQYGDSDIIHRRTNSIDYVRTYSIKERVNYDTILPNHHIIPNKELDRIQVITFGYMEIDNYPKMVETIRQDFDFGACMGTMYFKNGEPIIKIPYLSEIANRELKIKCGGWNSTSMERIKKYQKRGFQLCSDKDTVMGMIARRMTHTGIIRNYKMYLLANEPELFYGPQYKYGRRHKDMKELYLTQICNDCPVVMLYGDRKHTHYLRKTFGPGGKQSHHIYLPGFNLEKSKKIYQERLYQRSNRDHKKMHDKFYPS